MVPLIKASKKLYPKSFLSFKRCKQPRYRNRVVSFLKLDIGDINDSVGSVEGEKKYFFFVESLNTRHFPQH